ncbi:MAG: IS21 family transposase, partial [Deltaproteobacteria bacterium]|nr:IS21 family transposase [Deltaproteobacteria bacterium]
MVKIDGWHVKICSVLFFFLRLIFSVEKRRRKAWCFLMTLSCSRHCYAEVVFRQDIQTWIACHRNAFEFFGGVPDKIVMDNLKAAIIKVVLYEPLVNRTYREFAAHYNFVISPCLPGHPEHKGKVERGVPYVRNSFWKGSEFADRQQANISLIDWIMNTAGLRIHGTTKQKPLLVFETIEKQCLQALPITAYILSLWKNADVRRDCHVTIEGSFYSAPHHLRDEPVLIQSTETVVRIYHKNLLVATHLKTEPGQRRTINAHYPPHKVAYLEKTPQWCLARAKDNGPFTHQFVDVLLTRQHP